ncbi:MAG: hypothetical protein PHX87_03575 [Candidatus Peribacteraceae bacterium]|nr:hypothetical protein [Candidatus Peribacteraceae bacterium]MDD5742486.1 hypothetical protein [Candidatus Peribacteraceae bacterium]
MAETQRESPAAPEQRERISENEVRQALTRNRAENRPGNPRDAERQDAENEGDLGLLAMSAEMLPRDGKMFQKQLEKEKKKSDRPHLIDRQKNAQAVIGAYMQGLKQDLRAGFTEEDFRQPSRAHGKSIQRKIEAMLDQAQREGLVTVWNGRVANRVGDAAAWIEELQQMRNGPDLSPKQKQAVMRVERFFQMVLEGDPVYAQTQRAMSQKRPDSLAVQRGKGALKMLGVLAMAGMTLLSGLLDMKNRRISPYTLAWLGLTGWSVGFFRGQAKVVRDQLAFVPTKEWENLCKTLNIKGQDGVDMIAFIQRAHKQKNGKKALELLKKGRQQKQVNPQEYVRVLLGENPQGPDALMAAKLKTLSPAQLYALCQNLTSVTDREANALIRDFVEHNVNSQTVAPDLKQLETPPSASALSGKPQTHPPQG